MHMRGRTGFSALLLWARRPSLNPDLPGRHGISTWLAMWRCHQGQASLALMLGRLPIRASCTCFAARVPDQQTACLPADSLPWEGTVDMVGRSPEGQ